MKRFFLLLMALSFASALNAQEGEEQHGPKKDPYTWYIGFSLKPTHMSGLVSFFLLKYHGEELRETRSITLESFIMQAMGLVDSPANPDYLDWMDIYQVKHCVLIYLDSLSNKKDFRCPLVPDLWKLRYQEYPYHTASGDERQPGWGKLFESGVQRPSDRQIQILRRYGVENWFDIFKGENAYRLLHDMCNDKWVAEYQAARD